MYDESGDIVPLSTRTARKPRLTATAETQPHIEPWLAAVRAAESKQAHDIKVLDLRGVTSFADYFIVCHGANSKQNQAIADEIGLQLKEAGEMPSSVEGYDQAEWVLLDYGDYIVHIFSQKARDYYDLERLWRAAKLVEIPAEA